MTEPLESEEAFVTWVEKMIEKEGNLLGHREDAVAVKMGEQIMVINIDGWVESSDRPDGMTPWQVGYRAVCNAVSDVIAKGARPQGMIISSSIDEQHKQEMKEIIRGFRDASQMVGAPFFGGDMNSGKDLVIDVTVWGMTDRLIKRSGAKVGEEIYWIGPPLGCTAAALGILTKDWKGSKEKALRTMGEPSLFPEFLDLDATASIDCSDGLARSLYLLAQQSKIGIELNPELLPTDDWIVQVANDNNVNLLDLYLFGGEELGIVFTIDADDRDQKGQIEKLDHCVKIGKIVEGDDVKIGSKIIQNRGWDHFA